MRLGRDPGNEREISLLLRLSPEEYMLHTYVSVLPSRTSPLPSTLSDPVIKSNI